MFPNENEDESNETSEISKVNETEEKKLFARHKRGTRHLPGLQDDREGTRTEDGGVRTCGTDVNGTDEEERVLLIASAESNNNLLTMGLLLWRRLQEPRQEWIHSLSHLLLQYLPRK